MNFRFTQKTTYLLLLVSLMFVLNTTAQEKNTVLESKYSIDTLNTRHSSSHFFLASSDYRAYNLWLMVGLFYGVAFAAGLIWAYRTTSKQSIRLKLRTLYGKALPTHESQDNSVFSTIVHSQEVERNRMARELHDGLGGVLAGMKLQLSTMSYGENISSENIKNVILQMNNATSELDRISKGDVPVFFHNMGFGQSLVQLCEIMSSGPTEVLLKKDGFEKELELPMSFQLYLIIQELLTNVMKHANAKHVAVKCSYDESQFNILVEDDGTGFSENNPLAGMGLMNIQSRVTAMAGTLKIETEKVGGTKVRISVPA